jgi:hypothetical protein
VRSACLCQERLNHSPAHALHAIMRVGSSLFQRSSLSFMMISHIAKRAHKEHNDQEEQIKLHNVSFMRGEGMAFVPFHTKDRDGRARSISKSMRPFNYTLFFREVQYLSSGQEGAVDYFYRSKETFCEEVDPCSLSRGVMNAQREAWRGRDAVSSPPSSEEQTVPCRCAAHHFGGLSQSSQGK